MGLFHLSITCFYLLLGIANSVVALYIFSRIPEFTLRFSASWLSRVMYRIKKVGSAQIPEKGPAIIASNHVSFVDWLIIAGFSPRPIRFVVYAPLFKNPLFRLIFKLGKCIPIDSAKKNPEIYKSAFIQMAQALKNGELLCIFPEGKLTTDGNIDQLKHGIEKVIGATPVPVIPMVIQGMWGSMFSRKKENASAGLSLRLRSRVQLTAGSHIPPAEFSRTRLQRSMLKLFRPVQRTYSDPAR